MKNAILCELRKIIISDTQEQQIIVLQEASGERSFPIVIGFFEAHAIDRNIKEQASPRPMTHDLLLSIIEKLGGKLEKVVISELKNNTFYANLIIDQQGKEISIDARPSDAIALAAQNNTPIYVEKEVLDEVCNSEI